VLRLVTALVVALAGLAAWQLPWFDLLEGVAMMTFIAVVHAFLMARLRARTVVDALG
jgi:ABC-type uncharacterized transport system permease subunit